jgi:sugar phosphate isomerase/epimerase
MRLGGLIFKKWNTSEEWAQAAIAAGYRAVYFPVDYKASLSEIDSYVQAAAAHDLVIAEVGIWRNVLDHDPADKAAALEYSVKQLELADYVKARCCVNVAGSYSTTIWDGPHKDNLTKRGFDDIVTVTRQLLDTVNPKYTHYCLEPMPWMYPNTADSYLDLLKAIDHDHFGVHIDMVNVICSPEAYYHNGEIIKEWFDKLGSYILSCHAKDIRISDRLTTHLDECRPGQGELDYPVYLSCLTQLDPDTPLMLEHMTQEIDYIEGLRYIQSLMV